MAADEVSHGAIGSPVHPVLPFPPHPFSHKIIPALVPPCVSTGCQAGSQSPRNTGVRDCLAGTTLPHDYSHQALLPKTRFCAKPAVFLPVPAAATAGT